MTYPQVEETLKCLDGCLIPLKETLLRYWGCDFVLIRMRILQGDTPQGELVKICEVSREDHRAALASGVLEIPSNKTTDFWDGEPFESASIVSTPDARGMLSRLMPDDQDALMREHPGQANFLQRIRHRISFPLVLDGGKIGLVIGVSFASASPFSESKLPWTWLASQSVISKRLVEIEEPRRVAVNDSEPPSLPPGQHRGLLNCARFLPLLATVDFSSACRLFARLVCSGHGLGWHQACLISRRQGDSKAIIEAAFGALSGRGWMRDLEFSRRFGHLDGDAVDPLFDELAAEQVYDLSSEDDLANCLAAMPGGSCPCSWSELAQMVDPKVWEWAQEYLVLPQRHSGRPIRNLVNLDDADRVSNQAVLPMLGGETDFCLITSLTFGDDIQVTDRLRTFTGQIAACVAPLLRQQRNLKVAPAWQGRSPLLRVWNQTREELEKIAHTFQLQFHSDEEFVALQGQRVWESVGSVAQSSQVETPQANHTA